MYGTPVLGADIGGIPELIKVGETGELFESGNAENMKKKIEVIWNRDSLEAFNSSLIQFDTISEYTRSLCNLYI